MKKKTKTKVKKSIKNLNKKFTKKRIFPMQKRQFI